MTHAYARMYLADAEDCLSAAFDYAVYDCNVHSDVFAQAFVHSGYARLFEYGNPSVISGMSGLDLACKALSSCGLLDGEPQPTYGRTLSPEYWAGWALAQYQWDRACRFADIFALVPFSRIANLYHPLHEADIEVFMEHLDCLLTEAVPPQTALARMRKLQGISQAQLARLSGIGLKSIQAYEQRVNSINKASVDTLMALSRVLHCPMEDLLEYAPKVSIEYV